MLKRNKKVVRRQLQSGNPLGSTRRGHRRVGKPRTVTTLPLKDRNWSRVTVAFWIVTGKLGLGRPPLVTSSKEKKAHRRSNTTNTGPNR